MRDLFEILTPDRDPDRFLPADPHVVAGIGDPGLRSSPTGITDPGYNDRLRRPALIGERIITPGTFAMSSGASFAPSIATAID
jgi:hypothetical protein